MLYILHEAVKHTIFEALLKGLTDKVGVVPTKCPSKHIALDTPTVHVHLQVHFYPY